MRPVFILVAALLASAAGQAPPLPSALLDLPALILQVEKSGRKAQFAEADFQAVQVRRAYRKLLPALLAAAPPEDARGLGQAGLLLDQAIAARDTQKITDACDGLQLLCMGYIDRFRSARDPYVLLAERQLAVVLSASGQSQKEEGARLDDLTPLVCRLLSEAEEKVYRALVTETKHGEPGRAEALEKMLAGMERRKPVKRDPPAPASFLPPPPADSGW